MPTLDELHKAYMESREPEENYNYDFEPPNIEENEFTIWKQVSDSIDDPEEIRWKPVYRPRVEENEDVDTIKETKPNFDFLRAMRQKGFDK